MRVLSRAYKAVVAALAVFSGAARAFDPKDQPATASMFTSPEAAFIYMDPHAVFTGSPRLVGLLELAKQEPGHIHMIGGNSEDTQNTSEEFQKALIPMCLTNHNHSFMLQARDVYYLQRGFDYRELYALKDGEELTVEIPPASDVLMPAAFKAQTTFADLCNGDHDEITLKPYNTRLECSPEL